jgi:hypothetical protein
VRYNGASFRDGSHTNFWDRHLFASCSSVVPTGAIIFASSTTLPASSLDGQQMGQSFPQPRRVPQKQTHHQIGRQSAERTSTLFGSSRRRRPRTFVRGHVHGFPWLALRDHLLLAPVTMGATTTAFRPAIDDCPPFMSHEAAPIGALSASRNDLRGSQVSIFRRMPLRSHIRIMDG